MRSRLMILVCSLLSLAGCERSSTTRSPEPEPTDTAPAARDDEHVMSYGDQTIYVYASPWLKIEVERLFSVFEELRLEQVPLDATLRLPIGWTTLSIVVEGERSERLVVVEPNYDNAPETRTRPDISVSLGVLARQRAVLDQAGVVAGESIDFDEHVLAPRGALELDEVFLLRDESPDERMTGWRLSPANIPQGRERTNWRSLSQAEGAQTDSLPVYEILRTRPVLLDAMLLPAGYMAFYSGDMLTMIINERDEVVWSLSGVSN